MKKLLLGSTILAGLGAVFAWSQSSPVQAQAGGALVIQGATLIDGAGGAPVPNAVVVIQGNRVTAAGPAAQVQVPAGATVINAAGKYVLPGLWDGQSDYSWFMGEPDLDQGVTSVVDIALTAEVSVPIRDAVAHGLSRGPRYWTGISNMGGAGALTGFETLADREDIKTIEQMRARVQRTLAAGADMVIVQTGEFTPEMTKAAFDLAHAANKPGFIRASGPKTGIREAAEAGADWIPHSIGVSADVMKEGTRTNNELERFAAMDEAKAKSLIALLVQHHVYLAPTMASYSAGYPKDWARMRAETAKVFADSSLRMYYNKLALQQMEQRMAAEDPPAVHALRAAGYQNYLRFYKMFDAAGGRTIIAGDTNTQKNPGMIVHDEMEILQEAGLPAMHIIQAATSWQAEGMRVADKIGTVAAGKIADIIVVDANPLTDVANLRKISTVIEDGKVIERGFHSWYTVPFPAEPAAGARAVWDLPWTVALKKATFTGGIANAKAPTDPLESPQPAIETFSPVVITAGSAATTVKITGFNFVKKTRVMFDGHPVPYRWVSPTEIDAMLDANMLARAGRFDLHVVNPEPLAEEKWGDGTSNQAYLIVNFKY